jgi:hypothetical protein
MVTAKDPSPVPEAGIIPPETVGLGNVPMQTPLFITGAPPSVKTEPPLRALLFVITEIGAVVRVGKFRLSVENVSSLP